MIGPRMAKLALAAADTRYTVGLPPELGDLLDAVARAETALSAVMGLNPAVIEQLVEQALALADAGRLDEADAMLERLALVDPSPLLPMLLGSVRSERGEPAAAAEAYSEALRRDGGVSWRFDAEVRVLRARAYLQLGQPQAARADLAAASEAGSAAGRALLDALEEVQA